MSEQKKPVSLHQTRFKLAEFDRNLWSVEIPSDVKLEEMQDPGFWAHVAQKLKRGDRIEVIPENMSWYAELIVMDGGTTWAKTAPLRFVELEEVKIQDILLDGGRYKVEFAGKNLLYRIVDTQTKKTLKERLKTPIEAQNWFNDWLRSQSTPRQAAI